MIFGQIQSWFCFEVRQVNRGCNGFDNTESLNMSKWFQDEPPPSKIFPIECWPEKG